MKSIPPPDLNKPTRVPAVLRPDPKPEPVQGDGLIALSTWLNVLLTMACPESIPEKKWQRFKNDCALFVDSCFVDSWRNNSVKE
ncbi:MAG: hypothetical protein HQL91_06455 [Magnetococcales bacterium]|nr:hypothetical protein [Magnetococcales bacterium]